MENRDVARVLRETASLLEIDGAIIGRYRSYERVAELLDSLHESVAELAADPDPKKLRELPGVGERMAEHIQEILKTGDYALRKKLLKKYPATILDLLRLQSLGAKKVALLWKNFKAGTVDQVEQLARDGKLRDLAGFGEKSEQNILKAVEVFKRSSGRFLISQAQAAADKLIEYIGRAPVKLESVTAAGSLRRARETVGDLDLLVTFPKGQYSRKSVDAVEDYILKYPEIEETLARGENKVSVRLTNAMQVDVRLLELNNFGAAMIYFTGSKEHNVTLRGRANKMGYTLNEYALATLEGERRVAGTTEEEVYGKLKLDWIPPELRENTGEIDAAAEHRLPKLIELGDMLGDLQMHTTASDGNNSIEEMGTAAKALGYEYIALTDHSQAVTVANGMDERRTLEQIKKIREADARVDGIRLLAGIEVDIRKDGTLDLENEVLAQLDVVVSSVHSYMNLERAAMTERMLAAIENPYTQIIAHPTGRLLLRRDAFEYDFERILEAAKRRGVAVECNAAPERLDLKDVYLRMARDRGVRVVISTDAHSTRGLNAMHYGVSMARRGWLEKRDVINTLSLEKFLAALRPKPGAAANTPPAAKRKK
jgi:DNA polymerase (family 10)